VDGRPRRFYLGAGPLAEQAAAEDARRQAERRVGREARDVERQRHEVASGPLDHLVGLAELVVDAALLAAGYHQHAGSEWRRRREGAAGEGGDEARKEE
jgi:hypothetical protein